MKKITLLVLLSLYSFISVAGNILTPVKVTDNIWAVVGPLSNRTAENFGNNATFGFVITKKGVVVIDSGGSYLGAKQLHTAIKTITPKPIRYVINSGGQDHRWFGNDYFSSLGAKIIASKVTVADHKKSLPQQIERMTNTAGLPALKGTQPKYADITFDKNYKLSLGDTIFEVHFSGPAHTPGDSFIWLPKHKAVFSGDIVYTERMLGVNEHSNSKQWVTAFESFAKLKPKYLIPGHGKPTTLKKATQDTYNYLKFLRKSVANFMDEGMDISEIGKIDQSAFKYLSNFENLSGRNIQKVYRDMEWE